VSLVTVQDIIETGRQASPTSTVLAEWAEQGTPKQREQLHGMLLAEHESRHASRRQRPLSAARLPALKSLTGFDYSSVKFPEDYGREELTSVEFITRAEDLILYGDVGTGKNPPRQCPGRCCLSRGNSGRLLHDLVTGHAAAPRQRRRPPRSGTGHQSQKPASRN
jgi:hypothetical protein